MTKWDISLIIAVALLSIGFSYASYACPVDAETYKSNTKSVSYSKDGKQFTRQCEEAEAVKQAYGFEYWLCVDTEEINELESLDGKTTNN